MTHSPGAHDSAIVSPPQQEFKGVRLYPHAEQVEITTRAKFAVHDQVALVPMAVIEGLFLTILQMRLEARGLRVGLQADGPNKS